MEMNADISGGSGGYRTKILWLGNSSLFWVLMLGNMPISEIRHLPPPPSLPNSRFLTYSLILQFPTAFNMKTAKPNTSVPSGTSSTGKRPRNASNERYRAIPHKLK